MPIYQYDCKNQECKNSFEYFHVRSDDHASCPKCGGTDITKSEEPPKNTGFALKGTGWHNTDYSKRGRRGR